ncbi:MULTISPECIES: ABC transporter ATP-binding protein/permease [unclassified Enterococcus]|uniref:ABC transporter ATP-binding protein/permease n=1 Tax=unclassified Enterococcus TaxID=2608891 RepID=UPI0015543CB0|nr:MULTISPECIES: ABC transporter ATP-binding protein/permease [unclassified Enterococcus]MBS7578255.1 ABC transporter ATP-binding protein/permease [Enterococcus sp. MMGLQ5-2]MBS7585696.1 ABC transporter ATP-binding protein/permease [Enterococcus sp. MMGLQ5-1]NPD13555.1 ABC transporter ATP-binding protein/permease [Enterococcus sp. MMGLQ5-1]NPD38086.1 ABC transporter ATP-binding protein/permease [Enterococcus sp. MMGLQ5-2]
MINKRLFNLMTNQKKKIYGIVVFRLINLCNSIIFYLLIANIINQIYLNQFALKKVPFFTLAILVIILIKILLNHWISNLSFTSSSQLRLAIRDKIFAKAFQLGPSTKNHLSISALTQISVDGVEQLEVYYAQFIPQFFYSMIASLIVFFSLVTYDWQAAITLLICVPLIPISIMTIMKIAKKILSKYWNNYLNLGEVFFENLQGLTTLKVYQQDQHYHQKMNLAAEKFRKATMSLLSMQLNSITIMDIIAYTGSAIGISIALYHFSLGQLSIIGAVMFLLLSAEFFIPLRQLGSLFHVAMTGISAADKLFDFLDLPNDESKLSSADSVVSEAIGLLKISKLSFSYLNEKQAMLQDINFSAKKGQLTAIIGKSGSGKSTLASILSGFFYNYQGQINWDSQNLSELSAQQIFNTVDLINSDSFLFSKSIRENLCLGDKHINEKQLWDILERVNLADDIREFPNQLDYQLTEDGSNLSGGQRQRLLIARTLLRDKQIYIFDEITSSLDLENEKIIMKEIYNLSKNKIVILISHRLYNLLDAAQIIVLENGKISEHGHPEALLENNGFFKTVLNEEQSILKGGQ